MNGRKLTPTVSSMVKSVENIIDGYGMGSLRALAQEPVQNAKDAAVAGAGKTVRVEYRLLQRETREGNPCYVLTVTDTGTKGLCGPIKLSERELQERNFIPKRDEHWAAWEGQGFTKADKDALGSRGQGKAAFLYYSRLPGSYRRMLMLYDTLLPTDEYRFGFRYARPEDLKLDPPYLGVEAKQIIEHEYFDYGDEFTVPLRLSPLEKAGTRIIVPYLTDDVKSAFRDDVLYRWLQRCWWRAIQVGTLQIDIVDDERFAHKRVEVPEWWQRVSREGQHVPQRNQIIRMNGHSAHMKIIDNTQIGDREDAQIKNLVLFHDDALWEDEILDDQPEFAGIQLLRGEQWIETRGASQEYADLIPEGKRPGFRGFVEFTPQTEHELKRYEDSQHDGFSRRGIVRQILSFLEEQVSEFGEELGWERRVTESPQEVSRRDRKAFEQFVDVFLQMVPPRQKEKGQEVPLAIDWSCELYLDFPDRKIARVNWGKALSAVAIRLECKPVQRFKGGASVFLQLIDDRGNEQEIFRRKSAITNHMPQINDGWQLDLGDWQVLESELSPEEKQLVCPRKGKYRLRARVHHKDEWVAEHSRTLYVECDPPNRPPPKPQSLSISIARAEEHDRSLGQERFDHGDHINVQINAKNNLPEGGDFYLYARIGEAPWFVERAEKCLKGTPLGETPRRVPMYNGGWCLLDETSESSENGKGAEPVLLENGRHTIQAYLYDEGEDEVVAYASKYLYFQQNPPNTAVGLPFDLKEMLSDPSRPLPMWKMSDDLKTLEYPRDYPLRAELKEGQGAAKYVAGKQAFMIEIAANGLLEWAFRPYHEHAQECLGDDNNLEDLLRMAEQGKDAARTLWDDYEKMLIQLRDNKPADYMEYAGQWRETVALMLEIFRQEAG
ncbi:MAG: hypothetical protein OXF22_06780 [Anaerolineaceae bacterium]|nr:hypothetical protein [Anaerolineaceae bacterium]